MTATGKRSMSYQEIMKTNPEELEEIADTLDDDTLARIGHIGRFMIEVGNRMPNPSLTLGDVFTEEELQEIWRQTAEDDDSGEPCPIPLN
jgi:hypothetical protein